jgi:hypothetical protein
VDPEVAMTRTVRMMVMMGLVAAFTVASAVPQAANWPRGERLEAVTDSVVAAESERPGTR